MASKANVSGMSEDVLDLDDATPEEVIRFVLPAMFSQDDAELPTFEEYERALAEECADHFEGGSLYWLVSLSEYEAVYYDSCVILVERAINHREMLPPALATFTLDAIRGKRSRPRARGPKRSKNYMSGLTPLP